MMIYASRIVWESQMQDTLRIGRLRFAAGSAPSQPPLEIECPNVTILVGPNSAGKSQTLREIEAHCSGLEAPSALLEKIEITMPQDGEAVDRMMKIYQTEAPQGQGMQPGNIWFFRPRSRNNEQELRIQIPKTSFVDWHNDGNFDALRQYFVRFFTTRLDGRTRFELIDPKPTGDLEKTPENLLWHLFMSKPIREAVRKFTEQAFGKFFVVDPTAMTTFRVRLSNRAPANETEEQAVDDNARRFHGDAPVIQSLGDGVQTSVGLVAAVLALPDRIILIDEPEAFLHPTLARRVGKVLAKAARDRDASLIIASHSSELLLGCMQSEPNLRIVRLTYTGGLASARSLDPAEIRQLMNDPLLRSAHSLRALFHRGAIVCEADADRAFYEEINSRMSAAERGIEDCIFMNAQNWQTIPRLVEPLRRLGVPALAIFDFDVLMSDEFGPIWSLVNLDVADLHIMQNERASIKAAMENIGRANCKKLGVNALDIDKIDAIALLKKFASFGIMFVPVGELECWLKSQMQEQVSKKNWLFAMFEAMGADPDDAFYVNAGDDDVWEFIETARLWIDDPERRGMPH